MNPLSLLCSCFGRNDPAFDPSDAPALADSRIGQRREPSLELSVRSSSISRIAPRQSPPSYSSSTASDTSKGEVAPVPRPSLESAVFDELADAAAETVDAPSQHTAPEPKQPQYVNPALGAIKANGLKQYTHQGKPVYAAYPYGGQKPDKETGQQRREIGRGAYHVVEAKHNPNAPVFRKTPHKEFLHTEFSIVMRDAEQMDKVAQLLLADDEQTRRMSKHFALELLKEVRDGQPVYYTRAVNGFTLKDYSKDPSNYPELPADAIAAKGASLLAAVEWLHGKGYFHSDMHGANVMYDRDQQELVLIDMNSPKRIDYLSAEAKFLDSKSRLQFALNKCQQA